MEKILDKAVDVVADRSGDFAFYWFAGRVLDELTGLAIASIICYTIYKMYKGY